MEKYNFIEKIGGGSHGTAYLLKSQERNKFVVCKSFIEKHYKNAKKEIEILSQLNHSRIVRMEEHFAVPGTIFIILEYANYGTLESMIKYYTKSNIKPHTNIIWSILAQVSDALYYLHSKKIIHRDIKPANVLINKFYTKGIEYLEFKICDFSLSTKLKSYEEFVEDKLTVGTPFYMAPEMISKGKYNFTIDIWALGACLYETIKLKKAFIGTNREELYDSIMNKTIFPNEICQDQVLSQLICECLNKKNRINSKSIAKQDKCRVSLAILELKYREGKIECLENRLQEFNKNKVDMKIIK